MSWLSQFACSLNRRMQSARNDQYDHYEHYDQYDCIPEDPAANALPTSGNSEPQNANPEDCHCLFLALLTVTYKT